MVHHFTHVDLRLEDDAIGKCGCGGNTTAEIEVENLLYILNIEVGVFFSALMIILLVIVVAVLMKNLKDYCSCCWKEMDSEDDKLECCCHCWENFAIFTFYIFVFLFIVTYTLADNRWLWTYAIHDKDASFVTRIVFLVVSLTLTIVMGLVYICIICIPSVRIVRQCNHQTADHVTTANTDMLCCEKKCWEGHPTKCCKCCLFFKCCNCCVSKCCESCLECLSNLWKSNHDNETVLHVLHTNLYKEEDTNHLVITLSDGRKLELTEQVQDETGTKGWVISKTTGTEQKEAPSPVTGFVDSPPLAQNRTEDKLQQTEGPQDSPQIIPVERSTYTCDTEHDRENTPGSTYTCDTEHDRENTPGSTYTCDTERDTENTPGSTYTCDTERDTENTPGSTYTCDTERDTENTPGSTYTCDTERDRENTPGSTYTCDTEHDRENTPGSTYTCDTERDTENTPGT